MQPADENVSDGVAGIGQDRHRAVVNVGLQKDAAARDHLGGQPADEVLEDGDVVRREAPEDVLFLAHGPQVEAVAVEVFEPADLAALDELADLADGGMEQQHVADHQIDPLAPGQFGQGARLRGGECQRLFDHRGEACRENVARHLEVRLRRRRHGKAVKPGGHRLLYGRQHRRVRIALGQRLPRLFVGVDDAREAPQSGQRLDVVLAPAPRADDTDSFRHGTSPASR